MMFTLACVDKSDDRPYRLELVQITPVGETTNEIVRGCVLTKERAERITRECLV